MRLGFFGRFYEKLIGGYVCPVCRDNEWKYIKKTEVEKGHRKPNIQCQGCGHTYWKDDLGERCMN